MTSIHATFVHPSGFETSVYATGADLLGAFSDAQKQVTAGCKLRSYVLIDSKLHDIGERVYA